MCVLKNNVLSPSQVKQRMSSDETIFAVQTSFYEGGTMKPTHGW